MLLLITGSLDGTSDRIVSRLGEGVFRLNYDLWRDYELAYTPDSWWIRSPTGKTISSDTATGVFWWKPFAYLLGDDRLIREEVKYILRDVYGWFVSRGIAKGNLSDFHVKFGKINTLSYAQEYFKIPKTLVTLRHAGKDVLEGQSLVAKSLTSEISDQRTVMMTTAVDLPRLDPCFPWFLQSKVISDWDVTVFLCGRALFAFKRDRKELSGLDWRVEQDLKYTGQEWFPFDLSVDQSQRIFALSDVMGVQIGRFDFMTEGDTRELVFLEFNAHGQWVFLDIHDKYGLLDSVVEWLKNEQ